MTSTASPAEPPAASLRAPRASAILWLRRDLRLEDHAALGAAADLAAAQGAAVLPLVVLDTTITVSPARRARYEASVRALASSLEAAGGRLCIRRGDPIQVLPEAAASANASAVVVTGEHTPRALRRDARVAAALGAAGVAMTSAGSCHAVAPGTLFTRAGTPSKVFTPFFRTWLAHVREHGNLGQPLGPDPAHVAWHGCAATYSDVEIDTLPRSDQAGEQAAVRRWDAFRADFEHYAEERDRPDIDATSRLSVALRLGEVHPSRLIADLLEEHAEAAALSGSSPDGELGTDAHKFISEVAWRDFYADVLWHRPDSLWNDLNPAPTGIHDEVGAQFDAWREGRTGYPLVDAGMRQLLSEGWMHNRVRMVTASFLVKDLLLPWQRGAEHFLEHLLDGDPASNNHGWQWVAGTGTDASPYHRVMNPTAQAIRFDPQGDYVRRWIPELRHLDGKAALEPWKSPHGYQHGYPRQVVDHSEARTEALMRWRAARA